MPSMHSHDDLKYSSFDNDAIGWDLQLADRHKVEVIG